MTEQPDSITQAAEWALLPTQPDPDLRSGGAAAVVAAVTPLIEQRAINDFGDVFGHLAFHEGARFTPEQRAAISCVFSQYARRRTEGKQQ